MTPPQSTGFAEGDGARPQNLVFGWGAASFAEQLPTLDPIEAEHFDKDNAAIIRLSMRGFLTSSERDRAISRVTKEVRAKLSKPQRTSP